jgi:hypothetical protein
MNREQIRTLALDIRLPIPTLLSEEPEMQMLKLTLSLTALIPRFKSAGMPRFVFGVDHAKPFPAYSALVGGFSIAGIAHW